MRLFTKGCVYKSHTIEVMTPRLVQNSSDNCARSNPETDAKNFEQQPQISEAAADSLPEAEQSVSYILTEAERRAKEILGSSEAKANEIIRQSEIEAEAIHQRAIVQEEQLREELAETIREQVEQQAYSEGYQKGLAAAEIESREITKQAKSLFSMAQRALHEEYCRIDDSLLNLAMRVAKRLTGISLELEPRKLLDIARTLVLLPKEREGWRLHIAPEDRDWLKALSSEDQLPCPWVIDETLAQGDCFLECQEGIFDARVEAQLEKMEMILREELRNERLGSTGPEG
ncbi:MAG TPA: FliH/SctL family protein [Desulfitobacteriaceae bacterium]|nr:FliH/SctL family protein [Desulfitobacteriaceae bacterium]